MRHQSFYALHNGGFHRIAYTEWGDAANPHVVICVHGLARNSRDFDFLAEALAADCHVICMYVVGRGDSDWLDNKSDYTFSTYTADGAAMSAVAFCSCEHPAANTMNTRTPAMEWNFMSGRRANPVPLI